MQNTFRVGKPVLSMSSAKIIAKCFWLY